MLNVTHLRHNTDPPPEIKIGGISLIKLTLAHKW